MGFLEKLSQALQLNEEKKDSLHCMMGLVMLEWKELEGHLQVTKTCLRECFSELETREAQLKLVQESVCRTLEGFELKRIWVEKGFKKLEEKEKQLNGVLQKVEMETKQIGKIQDFVNEKLKDIAFGERHIEGLFGELRLIQNHLEKKEKELGSKEVSLERRKSECCSTEKWEIELKSKENIFQRRENELIQKGKIIESREKELVSREEIVGSKENGLDSKEKMLDRRSNELDSKDNILKTREDELTLKEDILESRGIELDSKHTNLERWEKRLYSDKVKLERMEDELYSREKYLERRENELYSKEEILKGRENDLDLKEKQCVEESATPNLSQYTKVRSSRKILGSSMLELRGSCEANAEDVDMDERNCSSSKKNCIDGKDDAETEKKAHPFDENQVNRLAASGQQIVLHDVSESNLDSKDNINSDAIKSPGSVEQTCSGRGVFPDVVKLGSRQAETASQKTVIAAFFTGKEPVSSSKPSGPEKPVVDTPTKRKNEEVHTDKRKKIQRIITPAKNKRW